MTAQINDTFHYREREYAVAGISEGELFDPALLELNPRGVCTACYRGYMAEFAVSNTRLVLRTLQVNLLNPSELTAEVGPTFCGVKPTTSLDEFEMFNNSYEGLNYHLEYTGGLLLGDGFIEDLYVHMGFHPAWKYEAVVELVFDAGILMAEYDRSDQMAEFRRGMLENKDEGDAHRMPTDDEIKRFVDRAFDRRYRF
jgi:hypothetical protein